jgi:putative phosphoribosyl transferase
MRFENRVEAGKLLAEKLMDYRDQPDVLVLALPRGGVPVAFEVAQALHAPLDVFLVRKLGVPGHEELALGAVAAGGVVVINRALMRSLQITRDQVEAVLASEEAELKRREQLYRDSRPEPEVRGKTVILVDDGLATGATMHASVLALRERNPGRIVVAVPTAAQETCDAFRDLVDDMVCATTPDPFYGVGQWYEDFSQTTDEEVRALLAQAQHA